MVLNILTMIKQIWASTHKTNLNSPHVSLTVCTGSVVDKKDIYVFGLEKNTLSIITFLISLLSVHLTHVYNFKSFLNLKRFL